MVGVEPGEYLGYAIVWSKVDGACPRRTYRHVVLSREEAQRVVDQLSALLAECLPHDADGAKKGDERG